MAYIGLLVAPPWCYLFSLTNDKVIALNTLNYTNEDIKLSAEGEARYSGLCTCLSANLDLVQLPKLNNVALISRTECMMDIEKQKENWLTVTQAWGISV